MATDHAQEAGLVKFTLQDRFLEIAESLHAPPRIGEPVHAGVP
jgi:hypothetical protein